MPRLRQDMFEPSQLIRDRNFEYEKIKENLIKDPSSIRSIKFTLSQKICLNYIIINLKDSSTIYITQSKIASSFDYSRKQINRAMNELKAMGIIDSTYNHLKASSYSIPNYLNKDLLYETVKEFCNEIKPMSAMCAYPKLNITSNRSDAAYKDVPHYEGSFGNLYSKMSHLYYNNIYIYKSVTLNTKSEVNDSYKISESVKNLGWLNLTKAGEIALSVYPEAAVIHAAQKVKSNKKISDLFRYFSKTCNNYCIENKIKPNWRLKSILTAYYEIPQDAEFTYKPSQVIPQRGTISHPLFVPSVSDRKNVVSLKERKPLTQEERNRLLKNNTWAQYIPEHKRREIDTFKNEQNQII
jgi:hypothetical protein